MSFPCGRQQGELLSRGRSLLSDLEPLNVSSEIRGPTLNVSEPEDEVMTANQTMFNHTLGNGTELTPRIVGGVLERQGESPWQVWTHFNSFGCSQKGC